MDFHGYVFVYLGMGFWTNKNDCPIEQPFLGLTICRSVPDSQCSRLRVQQGFSRKGIGFKGGFVDNKGGAILIIGFFVTTMLRASA